MNGSSQTAGFVPAQNRYVAPQRWRWSVCLLFSAFAMRSCFCGDCNGTANDTPAFSGKRPDGWSTNKRKHVDPGTHPPDSHIHRDHTTSWLTGVHRCSPGKDDKVIYICRHAHYVLGYEPCCLVLCFYNDASKDLLWNQKQNCWNSYPHWCDLSCSQQYINPS